MVERLLPRPNRGLSAVGPEGATNKLRGASSDRTQQDRKWNNTSRLLEAKIAFGVEKRVAAGSTLCHWIVMNGAAWFELPHSHNCLARTIVTCRDWGNNAMTIALLLHDNELCAADYGEMQHATYRSHDRERTAGKRCRGA